LARSRSSKHNAWVKFIIITSLAILTQYISSCRTIWIFLFSFLKSNILTNRKRS
jgi:hypothetical protein